MRLQHGDRIKVHNDHWDMVGREFDLLAVKYREGSTAVEVVLEDPIDESIYRLVLPENQIETLDPRGGGMKWIECNECGEEFRVLSDSDSLINYCPFCGDDITHTDEDREENEEDPW